MQRIPVLTALVAATGSIAIAAAGCGSGEDPPANAKRMSFALTDAGCEPHTAKIPAGPVAFEVENAGTSRVTEFEILDGESIVGEVENVAEGLPKTLTLTLEKGAYTLYCPGGSTERGKLTVTQ